MLNSWLLNDLDALLGQLKDSNCTQIIVRKPYGPGFHALLQAQRQRQSGSLPAKLTEVMVHPQALHPPQSPYPFIAMPSLSGEASPKRTNPTQHSSGQNVSTQNVPVQKVSRQTHILQEVSTQTKLPQKVPTQTHLSQKNLPLTHFPQSLHTDKVSANRAHADPCPVDEASPESLSADTHTQDVPTQWDLQHGNPPQVRPLQDNISRNSSGQLVDPRVDAPGWLVKDARQRQICYEYTLHGDCKWARTSCPRTHTTTKLNIYQLNALQVLAREIPCTLGNACQVWTCCFGHRCPFGGRCYMGKRCRFSKDMHITDTRIAG